jgi:hypothetical protein
MALPTRARAVRLRLPGLAALAVWGGLSLSSCVATTGDIDRIHSRIEAVEAAFESGVVEPCEVEEVRAALADTRMEVARVRNRPGALGGYALEIVLALIAATVPASVGLTNVVRNRARRNRGEPVYAPKRSRPIKPAPKLGVK